MRDLINPILDNIIPCLMDMLALMPDDEREPENPGDQTIHGKAFQVLSNIYEYHSDKVFSFILKYWQTHEPYSSTYPIQNSLLLTIAIVSRPPQSPQQANDIFNFLTRNLLSEGEFFITKFLIEAIAHPYKRMTDTALYVISLLLENFDLYMTDEYFDILLGQMQAHFMDHNIITGRVFAVINQLILRCYNFNHVSLYEKYYESLGTFCVKFLGFFSQTFNAPPSLLQTCSYVMINLIKYAPDSKQESVGKIFNQSMSTIDNFKDFQNMDNNSENFALVSDSIYFVIMCFHRFPNHFQHYGVPVAQKLLSIIKFRNVLLEECSYGLISIISSLGINVTNIFNDMLQCISFSLTSEKPSVIRAKVGVLAALYRTVLSEGVNNECAIELINRFPTTLQLIIDCLVKGNFERELNVKILMSLSKVIKSIAPKISKDERDNLMQLYRIFEYAY